MSDTTKVTVSACGYMNAYIKLQLKSFFLSSGGNSFKRRLAACCLQRQHSKKQNVLKKLDGPHKHSTGDYRSPFPPHKKKKKHDLANHNYGINVIFNYDKIRAAEMITKSLKSLL